METGKCGQLFTAQKTKHILAWSVQITDTANQFSGTCKCFHGYTGFACEKQRCEKYCHEHGECKSIAEMANSIPKSLSVTGVSTTKGSKIVLFDDSFSIPSTLSSNGGTQLS